jgi:hypothetical protein
MKPIHRIAAALLATAFTAPAWAADIVGSGRAVTEKRDASGFRGVALSIPGKLELVQGGSESLTLTADDNVAPLIETFVENGILRIRYRRDSGGALNVRTNTPIRMQLDAKTMESISVAGSSNVDARQLSTGALKVSIAGSGDVRLAGKGESLELSISGSGDVKAKEFETQRTTVSIAGSGDAEVTARAQLKASIAGSGDVRYHGDPSVQKSVVGSGRVRRAGAAAG